MQTPYLCHTEMQMSKIIYNGMENKEKRSKINNFADCYKGKVKNVYKSVPPKSNFGVKQLKQSMARRCVFE